jgi:TonB family protein
MNKKLLALGGVALLFGAINLGSRAAHSGTPRAPFEALLTPASCAQPQWPAEARRYEIEGATTIRFEIGADGKVRHAAVLRSSGWRILDEAALQGIAQCVFQPGLEAARLRTAFPLQYVWKLGGVAAVHPQLVPGSCQPHAGVQAFRQDDVRASGSDGVLLRFLVDADGMPARVVAEAEDVPPARVALAMQYLQSCRFAHDGKRPGEPTDTASGRVLFTTN